MKILAILTLLLVTGCKDTKFSTCDQCPVKSCETKNIEVTTAVDARKIFEESKTQALIEILDTIKRMAASGHTKWHHWYQDKQFTEDLAKILRTKGFKVTVKTTNTLDHELIVSW